MVLHNSPELMQNDVHLLNALMAQWGPCQFFRRGPLQEVKGVMALLERLVGSPTGIHNKPHTTSRRSCECLNKKMGPWNVPVFFHPLSVLPSDYNEPPGTGIPDGLLELIIRLHLLLSGHLGPPDTNCPYYGKIGIGKRLIRLEQLSVDGADPIKSMVERFITEGMSRGMSSN